MMGYWDGFGWWHSLGWVRMKLVCGLVRLGIIALVRGLTGPSAGRSEPREQTPFQIIKERYAKGELMRGQYEQMRGELD